MVSLKIKETCVAIKIGMITLVALINTLQIKKPNEHITIKQKI